VQCCCTCLWLVGFAAATRCAAVARLWTCSLAVSLLEARTLTCSTISACKQAHDALTHLDLRQEASMSVPFVFTWDLRWEWAYAMQCRTCHFALYLQSSLFVQQLSSAVTLCATMVKRWHVPSRLDLWGSLRGRLMAGKAHGQCLGQAALHMLSHHPRCCCMQPMWPGCKQAAWIQSSKSPLGQEGLDS